MDQSDLLELDTFMEDLIPSDDQPLPTSTMAKKSKPSTVATPTSSQKSQPYTSKQYLARRKRFSSASSTVSSSRNHKTKRPHHSTSKKTQKDRSYNPGRAPSLAPSTASQTPSNYSERPTPKPTANAIISNRYEKYNKEKAKGNPNPKLPKVFIPLDPPAKDQRQALKTPDSRDFSDQWSKRLSGLLNEEVEEITTVKNYFETVPDKNGLYLNLLQSISRRTFDFLRVYLTHANQGRALIAFTRYGDEIAHEWDNSLTRVLEPFHKSSPSPSNVRNLTDDLPFNTDISTVANFLKAMRNELITFSLKKIYFEVSEDPMHRYNLTRYFYRMHVPAPGTSEAEYIQFRNKNKKLVKACYRSNY